MGEIAEMMLDGTMDWETGEWNFDGEDGPGFPMTGAEAAAFRGCQRPGPAAFKMTKKVRARVAVFGELRQCSEYHWQVTKATAGETRNAEPIHRRDGDAEGDGVNPNSLAATQQGGEG